MYFTVPPNGVAKLDFGAHFQAPGLTVDVYGLQILDATLEAGNTVEAEEDTAASALLLKHEFLDGGADDVTLATLGKVLLEPTLTTLGNFLVRSNSQSSVASASFTVGGFQLEGYAMTLSAFAWNIVRTYTLTPGRRYSFGCRYRLGTASNLVMYVSAADNDYVGVTGTFLGTALQGVWSTARLDFSVPPGGIAKLSVTDLLADAAAQRRELHRRVHHGRGRLGRSLLRSPHSHRHRRRGHAVVHRGRVRQLAEHQRRGQRGPAELRHRNHGQHTHHQQPGQRRELHHGGRGVHGDIDGLGRSNRRASRPPGRSRAPRGGLRGPAGLREPGLHLHGHERRSVDGQRGLRRCDELGHGLRAKTFSNSQLEPLTVRQVKDSTHAKATQLPIQGVTHVHRVLHSVNSQHPT